MKKDLEARIKNLEDIEEIKKLKSSYIYRINERDWDGVLDCFWEDAAVDFGPFGKFEGQTLKKFFKEDFPPVTTFTLHMTADPIIEVNGDKAKGKWYMHESGTWTEGNRAFWCTSKYEDEFVKREGRWRCIFSLITVFYLTPYEEGWAKKSMMV
jgi:ketosteroid isomerase-like protein